MYSCKINSWGVALKILSDVNDVALQRQILHRVVKYTLSNVNCLLLQIAQNISSGDFYRDAQCVINIA